MPILYILAALAALFFIGKGGGATGATPKGGVSTPSPGPSTPSTDLAGIKSLTTGATGFATDTFSQVKSLIGLGAGIGGASFAGNATKPSSKGLTAGAAGPGNIATGDNSGVPQDNVDTKAVDDAIAGTDLSYDSGDGGEFADVGDETSFGDDSSYLDDEDYG